MSVLSEHIPTTIPICAVSYEFMKNLGWKPDHEEDMLWTKISGRYMYGFYETERLRDVVRVVAYAIINGQTEYYAAYDLKTIDELIKLCS